MEVDDDLYDDTHSLNLSLESFDPERLMPNHSIHSIYRSEESEPESDRSSAPWSPPAWRKGASGWQQRHHLPPPSPSRSRSSSPRYSMGLDDGEDTLLPANVPLPESPLKGTPRNSVDPAARMTSPLREMSLQPEREGTADRDPSAPPDANNCRLRFGGHYVSIADQSRY